MCVFFFSLANIKNNSDRNSSDTDQNYFFLVTNDILNMFIPPIDFLWDLIIQDRCIHRVRNDSWRGTPCPPRG